MKKILLSLVLATLALPVLAQFSTNAPPTREWIIDVNASTNLNAASIRITIQDCTFDAVSYVPLVTLKIEFRNDESPPFIFARKTLTLTAIQTKNWLAAPDPKALAKGLILGKAGLTEKP